MQPDDVMSRSPSPDAFAERAATLPRPSKTQLDDLQRAFDDAASRPLRSEWPPFLQRPRDLVDSRVTDAPSSHRPLVGPALVAAKRLFRGGFQPFINEMLRAQVLYNEAILDALAAIYDQLQQHAENQAAYRKQLEARLAELEKKKKR